MTHPRIYPFGLAAVLFVGGCGVAGQLASILTDDTTTVRLVNNSDFPVEVNIYIDDNQDIPEELIDEDGTFIQYTIPAGETQTFSRDCDDLQAIIIDDADLMVVNAEIGPEDRTDVFRDGDDFNCGDTLVFTFDHSDILIDFAVTFQRQ